MRVIENGISVADQQDDPNSVLNFWRNLLKIRKAHPALFAFGKFDLHDADNKYTMTYTKTSYKGGKGALLVVLNFSGQEQKYEVPQDAATGNRELIASAVASPREGVLDPWEGKVYLIS